MTSLPQDVTGWYTRRITKEKEVDAVNKQIQEIVQQLVSGTVKMRNTSEGKLYERFYTKAPTNILVLRREFRKTFPLWLEILKKNVESGKWEDDPTASETSIPPDDSDVAPFEEDPDYGPFFNTQIERFSAIDLANDPNPKGPWWSRCKTVQVFQMQAGYPSSESRVSLIFFQLRMKCMHEMLPLEQDEVRKDLKRRKRRQAELLGPQDPNEPQSDKQRTK